MPETMEPESEPELRARVLRLEKELQEARSLFNIVFDSGPFPMWMSNDKGTCVKINDAFRRIWGATDEALIGKYNMFNDPVVREQGFIPMLEGVFKEGSTVQLQIEYDPLRFNQLAGAHRKVKSVFEAVISPIKDARGKVTNVIIQHKDLTDLRLAEEEKEKAITQMKQAQRMEAIGILAAGVAHEINQPLTYIKAIFECTLHDLETQKIIPQSLEEDCREAVIQVNRISRIIGHLRMFGRAEAMSFKEDQLQRVLDDTLILVGQLLKDNDIHLKRDIQKNLPSIQCDPGRLEQVFINLFQNSIAALKEVQDKQITITMVALNGLLILCFYDNGVGISPDLQHKIFEPFVTTKEVGDGMGLGLSIVYGIVKEHQGDIQYYEEEQGSSFVITLPLHAAAKSLVE